MSDIQSVSQLQGKSSFQVMKWCFSQANKYFFPLTVHTTVSLWLVIFLLVPLWQYYINNFGMEHIVPTIFELFIYVAIPSLELFMSAIWLYNKTKKPDKPLRLWPFTVQVAWPWLWEGLKVSIIFILATFLLIVPGIIKTIHYMMVPYVVFFNKSYKEGKLDALKYSEDLSKNFRWWIFFVFLIIPALCSWPLTKALKIAHGITDQWLKYLMIFLELYVLGLISLYFIIALYFLYYYKDKSNMTGMAP